MAGDSEFPQIADPTAPFVYARIMGTSEAEKLGYAPPRSSTLGGPREGLGRGELAGVRPSPARRRPASRPRVYLYVISGHGEQPVGGDGADRTGNVRGGDLV